MTFTPNRTYSCVLLRKLFWGTLFLVSISTVPGCKKQQSLDDSAQTQNGLNVRPLEMRDVRYNTTVRGIYDYSARPNENNAQKSLGTNTQTTINTAERTITYEKNATSQVSPHALTQVLRNVSDPLLPRSQSLKEYDQISDTLADMKKNGTPKETIEKTKELRKSLFKQLPLLEKARVFTFESAVLKWKYTFFALAAAVGGGAVVGGAQGLNNSFCLLLDDLKYRPDLFTLLAHALVNLPVVTITGAVRGGTQAGRKTYVAIEGIVKGLMDALFVRGQSDIDKGTYKLHKSYTKLTPQSQNVVNQLFAHSRYFISADGKPRPAGTLSELDQLNLSDLLRAL